MLLVCLLWNRVKLTNYVTGCEDEFLKIEVIWLTRWYKSSLPVPKFDIVFNRVFSSCDPTVKTLPLFYIWGYTIAHNCNWLRHILMLWLCQWCLLMESLNTRGFESVCCLSRVEFLFSKWKYIEKAKSIYNLCSRKKDISFKNFPISP